MWLIDDPDLSEDLRKVHDRVGELVGEDDRVGLLVTDSSADPSQDGIVSVGVDLIKPATDVIKECRCCCAAHCKVQFHNIYGSRDMDLEETFLEDEEEELCDPDNLTAYLVSVATSWNYKTLQYIFH